MRRKFKHKVTDWKAIESGFADQHYKIYNAIDDYEGDLSFGMVENSNDWQEITESQFVEGRWYIARNRCVFRCIEPQERRIIGDNFVPYDSYGKIHENGILPERSPVCTIEDVNREATFGEIRDALYAISKHKGLSGGVKVESPAGGNTFRISFPFHYNSSHDALYDVNKMAIYDEGIWAEKIREPILVTEDGYELNYHDKYYMVGENFKVQEKLLSEGTLFSNAARRFYKKENAEAYIERCKPRYSKDDLNHLRKKVLNVFNSLSDQNQIENEVLKAISIMEDSKND